MIEFDVPKEADGEATPFYDMVIGMRIVDLCDIGQFILMNPVEHTEGGKIIKSCKGYSLEYEFTYKRITLENSTYNFWNPTTPDATIMGIVMKLMPSWRIGYIDDNLVGKYRTYEVSDENLYNFLKDTIQTSYGCIFEFDTYTRTVNAISTASIGHDDIEGVETVVVSEFDGGNVVYKQQNLVDELILTVLEG